MNIKALVQSIGIVSGLLIFIILATLLFKYSFISFMIMIGTIYFSILVFIGYVILNRK